MGPFESAAYAAIAGYTVEPTGKGVWSFVHLERGYRVEITLCSLLEPLASGWQVLITRPGDDEFWTCPVETRDIREAHYYAVGFLAGHKNAQGRD